jgi:uncharacterized protein (TIRG00374 family)
MKTGAMMKLSDKVRRVLITILKICLVIALFWYMVDIGLISPKHIKGLFTIELLPAVGLAALTILTSFALAALRQKILLETIPIRLSFSQSFYLVYVGAFFNNILPGATGGDVTRMYLLGKENRGAISNIAGFVLFDRVIGFSTIALMAAFAVGYTVAWEAARLHAACTGLLVGVFLACLAPVCFFAALFFARIPFVRNLGRKVFSMAPKSAALVNFFLTLEGFSQKKGVVARAFGISLLSFAAQLIGVAALSRFMFGWGSVYPALVATPLVMISSIIPLTPGNIGGAEYLSGILWQLFGQDGGATMLASWRLISVILSLFGGVLYLFKFRAPDFSDEGPRIPSVPGLIPEPRKVPE